MARRKTRRGTRRRLSIGQASRACKGLGKRKRSACMRAKMSGGSVRKRRKTSGRRRRRR